MRNVLIAECMQEISSFNPVPSGYEDFAIQRGDGLLAQAGLNTAVGGALEVFGERDDLSVVPTIGARAGSAGPLSASGWSRLRGEILDAIAGESEDVAGL